MVGEIDEANTQDGTIVCQDGFRATTMGSGGFLKLFETLGLETKVQEVDGSSVFATGLVARRSASTSPDQPRPD